MLERLRRRTLFAFLRRYLGRRGLSHLADFGRRGEATRRLDWRIEGPFDSSYSLAIENRELALALAELGERVTLESRDGPGPFAPNPGFLAANPRVAAMWEAGRSGQSLGWSCAIPIRRSSPT